MLLPSHAPGLDLRPLRGRAFALLFVATFAAQAGALLAFNLVVDPRSEFPVDVVRPLTEDARATTVRAIATMDAPPDVLVLGSSRAWGIDPASFTQRGYASAYNAAFGSATTAETLEMYRHVVREQGPPRLLFYAFEDWQLDATHASPLDLDVATGLSDVAAYAPQLLRSLHPDYLRDSLRALELEREGHPPRAWAHLPGGNVAWEREEQARAAGGSHFDEELQALRAYAAEHYAAPPDPSRVEALRTLVREARADGVEVVLVLTPLHPEARALLPPAAEPALAQARALAVSLCSEGVRVHDLLDPASYGSDLSGFVDGWHYDAAEGDRLVAHALASPGSCGAAGHRGSAPQAT